MSDDTDTTLAATGATFYNLEGRPTPAQVSATVPAHASVGFWMSDLLTYLREHGTTRMENTVEAEQAWQEHVRAMYDMLLLRNTKSWFTGYNSNVEGRDTIRYVVYNGGAPRYRRRLAECAAKDYEGFVLT